MSVLDLGCGSGLNALRATRSGASATGVDINRRAVRVARFNQLINGVYDAFFVHSDWNSFSGSDYDLTVSQPPFDPDLPGCAPVYAWLGGGCFGLRYTCELIERFCPRVPGARMTLYVHSFATSNGPLLQELLPGCVGDGCASSFELLRSNTLSSWWSKYRERHRLEDSCPIPAEWSSVEFVGAYVVRITKM
jgi:SAM-dependent methyltransferase